VEPVSLSYLSFLVPGPKTKLSFGAYLTSPIGIFYLASDLLLGDLLFCHSFLIVPETPVPLLGWDLLSQLKAQILLPPGSYLCCSLLQGEKKKKGY
jgi:hypothetical protein